MFKWIPLLLVLMMRRTAEGGSCDSSPCQQGGTCLEDPAGHRCSCPVGYLGKVCQTDIPIHLSMRGTVTPIQGKGVSADVYNSPEVTSDGSFDHVVLDGESQWLGLTGHTDDCFGDVTRCAQGATYGLWFKLSPDEVTNTSYLVTSGGDVEGADGLVIYFRDPHLFILLRDGSTQFGPVVWPIRTARWYHVMVTWSSGGGLGVYGDGVLLAVSEGTAYSSTAPQADWTLGSGGGGAGGYLRARLADWVFWDRQLTEAEVRQAYVDMAFDDCGLSLTNLATTPNRPADRSLVIETGRPTTCTGRLAGLDYLADNVGSFNLGLWDQSAAPTYTLTTYLPVSTLRLLPGAGRFNHNLRSRVSAVEVTPDVVFGVHYSALVWNPYLFTVPPDPMEMTTVAMTTANANFTGTTPTTTTTTTTPAPMTLEPWVDVTVAGVVSAVDSRRSLADSPGYSSADLGPVVDETCTDTTYTKDNQLTASPAGHTSRLLLRPYVVRDPCLSEPCLGNSTCENRGYAEYFCSCPIWSTGPLCQHSVGFPAQELSTLEGADGPDLVILNASLTVGGALVGVTFHALTAGSFWVGVWGVQEDGPLQVNLTAKTQVTATTAGTQTAMFSDGDVVQVSPGQLLGVHYSSGSAAPVIPLSAQGPEPNASLVALTAHSMYDSQLDLGTILSPNWSENDTYTFALQPHIRMDPCYSSPCVENSTCVGSPETSTYRCYCVEGRFGHDCETEGTNLVRLSDIRFYQKSTNRTGTAEQAGDGSREPGLCVGCALTTPEIQPWWVVDFRTVRTPTLFRISGLEILDENGDAPGRVEVAVVLTSNFYTRAWQVESYTPCGTFNYTNVSSLPLEVVCWPVPSLARFAAVKVLSNHLNVSLSLCEVEVYNANPCVSDPCYHGGICNYYGGYSFYCTCPIEYTGRQCQNETRFKLLVYKEMILPDSCELLSKTTQHYLSSCRDGAMVENGNLLSYGGIKNCRVYNCSSLNVTYSPANSKFSTYRLVHRGWQFPYTYTGGDLQRAGPTTLSTLFVDQAFLVSGWLRGVEVLTVRPCGDLSVGVWQPLEDAGQYRLLHLFSFTVKARTTHRGHYHHNPVWVQRGHVLGLHYNYTRAASRYCVAALEEGGALGGSGLEDGDLSRTLVNDRLSTYYLTTGTIYNFTTAGPRMNLAIRPLIMGEERDECDRNPCQNNGTCVLHVGGAYRCLCPPFTSGGHCEQVLYCKASDNNLCHRGSCRERRQPQTYWCYSCGSNYIGQSCEFENPCTSSPCQGGSPCIYDHYRSTFWCNCTARGRYGVYCEQDPCASDPCANGGTCERQMAPDYWSCACRFPYVGQTCGTPRTVMTEDRPVNASSQSGANAPAVLTDGSSSNQNECFSTRAQTHPWVVVDMGVTTNISMVRLISKRTGYSSMKKIMVAVSESEDILRPESLWYSHTKCNYVEAGFTRYHMWVTCEPGGLAGRFVGVMMYKQGTLTLCEVQAFQDNCVSNPCQNGGTCSIHSLDHYCTCPPWTTGYNCEHTYEDVAADLSLLVPASMGASTACPQQTAGTSSSLGDCKQTALQAGSNYLTFDPSSSTCTGYMCEGGDLQLYWAAGGGAAFDLYRIIETTFSVVGFELLFSAHDKVRSQCALTDVTDLSYTTFTVEECANRTTAACGNVFNWFGGTCQVLNCSSTCTPNVTAHSYGFYVFRALSLSDTCGESGTTTTSTTTTSTTTTSTTTTSTTTTSTSSVTTQPTSQTTEEITDPPTTAPMTTTAETTAPPTTAPVTTTAARASSMTTTKQFFTDVYDNSTETTEVSGLMTTSYVDPCYVPPPTTLPPPTDLLVILVAGWAAPGLPCAYTPPVDKYFRPETLKVTALGRSGQSTTRVFPDLRVQAPSTVVGWSYYPLHPGTFSAALWNGSDADFRLVGSSVLQAASGGLDSVTDFRLSRSDRFRTTAGDVVGLHYPVAGAQWVVPVADGASLGGYSNNDLSRALTGGALYTPAVGSSYTFSTPGTRATPALRPLLLPDFETGCTASPCQNQGTCTDLYPSYSCACTEPAYGDNCQHYDYCRCDPCHNGGTCRGEVAPAYYNCTCPPGFFGQSCEYEDPCVSDPCQHAGTCIIPEFGFRYECNCTTGYINTHCEDTYCVSNPCQWGGTCVSLHDTLDETYFCVCPPERSGPYCEYNEPCVPTPCQNQATCSPDIYSDTYNCTCAVGWQGTHCDVDFCSSNPCINSGTCLAAFSDSAQHECACTKMWTGYFCDVFNPCNSDPCMNEATCIGDMTGNFTCNCTAGWSGLQCEVGQDTCELWYSLGYSQTRQYLIDPDGEGGPDPPYGALCTMTPGAVTTSVSPARPGPLTTTPGGPTVVSLGYTDGTDSVNFTTVRTLVEQSEQCYLEVSYSCSGLGLEAVTWTAYSGNETSDWTNTSTLCLDGQCTCLTSGGSGVDTGVIFDTPDMPVTQITLTPASVSEQATITIGDMTCYSECISVSFLSTYQSLETPLYVSSGNIEVVVAVSGACSSERLYRWYTANVTAEGAGGATTQTPLSDGEADLSLLSQEYYDGGRSNTLRIRGKVLDVGLYKVKVEVVGTLNETSAWLYLGVLKSEMVVRLAGGNLRVVPRQYTELLDAGALSYDLEDRTSSRGPMTFTWSCKIGLVEAGDPTDGHFPAGSLCDAEMPGLFSHTGPTWEVNSAALVAGDYTFRVVGEKEGQTATFDQVLRVVDSYVPSVGVRYLLNCGVKVNVNYVSISVEWRCLRNCGVKVNVNRKLSLLLECTEDVCVELPSVSYRWRLYYTNYTASYPVPLPDVVTQGEYLEGLVLPPSSLLPGASYRVAVELQCAHCGPALAEYHVTTAHLIIPGVCGVSPPGGRAWETPFVLTCEGWASGAGAATLSYRVTTYGMGQTQLLYSGRQAQTPALPLPLGDPGSGYRRDVTVEVTDVYGASASLKLSITVELPVQTTPDIFLSHLAAYQTTLSALNLAVVNGSTLGMEVALGRLTSDAVSLNTTSTTLTQHLHAMATVLNARVSSMPSVAPSRKRRSTTNQTALMSMSHHDVLEIRNQMSRTLSMVASLAYQVDDVVQISDAIRNMAEVPEEVNDDTLLEACGALIKLTDLGMALLPNNSDDTDRLTEAVVLASWAAQRTTPANVSLPEYDGLSEYDLPPDKALKVAALENASLSDAENTYYTRMVRGRLADYRRGQWDTTRTTVGLLQGVQDAMGAALLAVQCPLEDATSLLTTNNSLTVYRARSSRFPNATFSFVSGALELPPGSGFGLDRDHMVDLQVLANVEGPYTWTETEESVDSVTTNVTFTSAVNRTTVTPNTTYELTFTGTPAPPADWTYNLSTLSPTGLTYHKLSVSQPNPLVLLQFNVTANSSGLELYLRRAALPTLEDYSIRFVVANSSSTLHLPSSLTPGLYYLGLREAGVGPAQTPERYKLGKLKHDRRRRSVSEGGGVQYTLDVLTTACQTWDDGLGEWKASSSPDAERTAVGVTRCWVDPAQTGVSAATFTTPLHRSVVVWLPWLPLNSSMLVAGVILSSLLVYCLLLVYAFRNDIQDPDRWEPADLDDKPEASFEYILTVETGLFPGCGTSSQVLFTLFGRYANTGVRRLRSENRQTLGAGSVATFRMTSDLFLGAITKLHVWHAETQRHASRRSWYIENLVVNDPQEKVTTTFVCRAWLRGRPRVFYPTPPEDRAHLDYHLHRAYLAEKVDAHLPLSVFLRPRPTHFSRAERLSVVMATVSVGGLVSCLVYRYGGVDLGAWPSVQAGYLSFSLYHVLIGIASLIIASPISVIFEYLFKEVHKKKEIIDDILTRHNIEILQARSRQGSLRSLRPGSPLGPLTRSHTPYGRLASSSSAGSHPGEVTPTKDTFVLDDETADILARYNDQGEDSDELINYNGDGDIPDSETAVIPDGYNDVTLGGELGYLAPVHGNSHLLIGANNDMVDMDILTRYNSLIMEDVARPPEDAGSLSEAESGLGSYEVHRDSVSSGRSLLGADHGGLGALNVNNNAGSEDADDGGGPSDRGLGIAGIASLKAKAKAAKKKKKAEMKAKKEAVGEAPEADPTDGPAVDDKEAGDSQEDSKGPDDTATSKPGLGIAGLGSLKEKAMMAKKRIKAQLKAKKSAEKDSADKDGQDENAPDAASDEKDGAAQDGSAQPKEVTTTLSGIASLKAKAMMAKKNIKAKLKARKQAAKDPNEGDSSHEDSPRPEPTSLSIPGFIMNALTTKSIKPSEAQQPGEGGDSLTVPGGTDAAVESWVISTAPGVPSPDITSPTSGPPEQGDNPPPDMTSPTSGPPEQGDNPPPDMTIPTSGPPEEAGTKPPQIILSPAHTVLDMAPQGEADPGALHDEDPAIPKIIITPTHSCLDLKKEASRGNFDVGTSQVPDILITPSQTALDLHDKAEGEASGPASSESKDVDMFADHVGDYSSDEVDLPSFPASPAAKVIMVGEATGDDGTEHMDVFDFSQFEPPTDSEMGAIPSDLLQYLSEGVYTGEESDAFDFSQYLPSAEKDGTEETNLLSETIIEKENTNFILPSTEEDNTEEYNLLLETFNEKEDTNIIVPSSEDHTTEQSDGLQTSAQTDTKSENGDFIDLGQPQSPAETAEDTAEVSNISASECAAGKETDNSEGLEKTHHLTENNRLAALLWSRNPTSFHGRAVPPPAGLTDIESPRDRDVFATSLTAALYAQIQATPGIATQDGDEHPPPSDEHPPPSDEHPPPSDEHPQPNPGLSAALYMGTGHQPNPPADWAEPATAAAWDDYDQDPPTYEEYMYGEDMENEGLGEMSYMPQYGNMSRRQSTIVGELDPGYTLETHPTNVGLLTGDGRGEEEEEEEDGDAMLARYGMVAASYRRASRVSAVMQLATAEEGAQTYTAGIETEESVEALLEQHGLVSTGDEDMDRHMLAMMMQAQDILPDDSQDTHAEELLLKDQVMDHRSNPYYWRLQGLWVGLMVLIAAPPVAILLISLWWDPELVLGWTVSYVSVLVAAVCVFYPLQVFFVGYYKGVQTHKNIPKERGYIGHTILEAEKEGTSRASRWRRLSEVARSAGWEACCSLLLVGCGFSLLVAASSGTQLRLHNLLCNTFLKPLHQVQDQATFLTWLEDVVVPAYYPTVDDRGADLHWRRRVYTQDQENLQLGVIGVRQLRVLPAENRSVPHDVPWVSPAYPSYPDYSSSRQDLSALGPALLRAPTAHYYYPSQRAWTAPAVHSTLTDLTWGDYSTYGGRGQEVSLALNQQVAAQTVRELGTWGWLDRATRAVVVDFGVYNPNTNLFGSVQVVAEFLPVGGATTRGSVTAFEAFGAGPLTYYSYGCLIMVVVLFCVGLLTDSLHLVTLGWAEFRRRPERLASCSVLLMTLVLTLAFTVRWYVMEDAVGRVQAARGSSGGSPAPHLGSAALADEAYRTVLGLFNVAVLLRLLVLSRVWATMSRTLVTLQALLRELVACSPFVLSLFLAYAGLLHLRLAPYHRAFSTLPRAALEVVSMAARASGRGGASSSEQDAVLTGLVFASFVVVVQVVGCRLVTAVVLTTYSHLVRSDAFDRYKHEVTDAALSDLLLSAAPQGDSLTTKPDVTADPPEEGEAEPEEGVSDKVGEQGPRIDMTLIYPEKCS